MYMCFSADMGTVLKVVTIPRESWHDLEEVVLEEMTVFRVRLGELSVNSNLWFVKPSAVCRRWCENICVCSVQEPTPITAMELSTKQVRMAFSTRRLCRNVLTKQQGQGKQKKPRTPGLQTKHWHLKIKTSDVAARNRVLNHFVLNQNLSNWATQEHSFFTSLLSPAPTATAVPWLGPGRIADVLASLWSVWESLRRVLLSQGSLLRLGRHRVLQILSDRQEVGAHTRALNTFFLRKHNLRAFVAFAERMPRFSNVPTLCVNVSTCSHTWDLSQHLHGAVATRF